MWLTAWAYHLTLPNGVLVEYGYDAAWRVTSISYKQNGTTLLGDLTYEYDKTGNRTQIGGSFARTGIPQATGSTAYNAANHQTTFGDKTLTYDNNGNLQTTTDSSGTTTYTWNARNQLVGISGPSISASFVYDGLGRREKKTINSNLTEFLFDGVNPVQETSGATVLANILTGLGIDEFLTRTDVPAGVNSHLLTDALGSTIALADSSGVVQTELTYEPFGKTTATGASNSNPFRYTGRENDSTGLYYYRARYYHPQLQRFISEDPVSLDSTILMAQMWSKYGALFEEILRDPQQQNPYAYVTNNPVLYTDSEGELLPLVLQRLAAWLALGGMVSENVGPAIVCFSLATTASLMTRTRTQNASRIRHPIQKKKGDWAKSKPPRKSSQVSRSETEATENAKAGTTTV